MTTEQSSNLFQALNSYTPISPPDFGIAIPFFVTKKVVKNDSFNLAGTICQQLAFIQKGMFRIFLTDATTGEEQNLFFFAENQFLVSIYSFLTQTPCLYTIEALEDAELVQISHKNLMDIYLKSHRWESFGRKLAEQHFIFLQERTEALLTKTAEERYLDMLKKFPNITNRVSLYHIASYIGIKGPSLSRIRKKMLNSTQS